MSKLIVPARLVNAAEEGGEMIKIGDTIEWTYKHSLNTKSKTLITKIGKVVKVEEDVVKVLFAGNKHSYWYLKLELHKAGEI